MMTTDSPLLTISVITAVYDAETTVAQAIASVAAQRHPHLEHLIVEGLSRDGSLAAVRAAAHPRMTLVSEADAGLYDALNKGIARATGDVIGFVHADDFLPHPDVLSQIAAAFADPAVEAVFGDLDYVAQGDATRIVRRWSTGAFHPARLRRGWMPAHPTLYLRRGVYDRIGGFDTSYGIAADYDLILRYFATTTARTVHLPQVVYKMRMGGVSNRDWRRIRQKMAEDWRAIRGNRVGGLMTLAAKNLSKIGQFGPRRAAKGDRP